MERTVRKDAVAFGRWTAAGGLSRGECAALLGLSPETLGRWDRSWRKDRLPPRPRGRPARRLGRAERREVVRAIRDVGPCLGTPTLQAMFPDVARRELADLAGRYRRHYVRNDIVTVFITHWWRVGAVWAMDYTEPPLPIDDLYPYLLEVRDMASGYQLLSLPTEVATAEVTRDALRLLFAAYGEPLVIKSDNGGAVEGDVVARLLEERGVIPFLSPGYMPEYNGACEGGIGAVKITTHHVAARNGHPERWTCDDVEGARVLCNDTVHRYPGGSSTPAARWAARVPVAPFLRDAFAESVECRFAEETANDNDRHRKAQEAAQRAAPGHGALRRRVYDQNGGPAARRQAVLRALVEHGLFSLECRRITLPVNSVSRGKIT